MHEEIISSEAENVVNFFRENPEKLRGEFVIIVEKAGKDEKNFDEKDLIKQIKTAISAGESLKDLSQNLAEIYKINKKEIYQMALNLSKN